MPKNPINKTDPLKIDNPIKHRNLSPFNAYEEGFHKKMDQERGQKRSPLFSGSWKNQAFKELAEFYRFNDERQ